MERLITLTASCAVLSLVAGSVTAEESRTLRLQTPQTTISKEPTQLPSRQSTQTVTPLRQANPVLQNSVSAVTVNRLPPRVDFFQLDQSAAMTHDRRVTLNHSAFGAPTHYRVSERSDFANAAWQPYQAAPEFTLSRGNRNKRVYFQIKSDKDGNSVSSKVVNDVIQLQTPYVASFNLNNGAATSDERLVTLNNSAAGAPTQFRVSESQRFTGATWRNYNQAPTFMLSNVAGDKRVYFQTRNNDGLSNIVSDDINIPYPFDRFDADATTQSWQRTYLLSLLSWLAYFPQGMAQSQLKTMGLTANDDGFFDLHSEVGSTQGYIAYNDEVVFVSFQGSTSTYFGKDWTHTNFNLQPLSVPNWGEDVILHNGFTKAAATTYSRVKSRVTDLLKENPNRKVWLTGHSLGGAVAKLTAFRLEHETDIDVAGVYTYGAPAVGNSAWANVFNSKVNNVHRWSLQHDPVVSILPASAFSHVGTNNNLYTVHNHAVPTHGWNDPVYFNYDIDGRVISPILIDHMAYWCRLHEELEHHDETAALYPVPPSNNQPGCMDS